MVLHLAARFFLLQQRWHLETRIGTTAALFFMQRCHPQTQFWGCNVWWCCQTEKKKKIIYISTIWKTTEDKICLFTYFNTTSEHPIKDLLEGSDIFFINWTHFWRLLKSKFINSISILTAYKHLNNWAGAILQTMLKDINLNWVCTNFSRNISLMSWNRHFSKTVLTNLMNSISNNDIKLSTIKCALQIYVPQSHVWAHVRLFIEIYLKR